MSDVKVACTGCGAHILPTTAKRTGGLCMPCRTGTRRSSNDSVTNADEPSGAEAIDRIAREYRGLTDAQVLERLRALAPLLDENDPAWQRHEYWREAGYTYVALSDVVCERRLVEAIPLLLDRACFGDPGEIMRGIRHALEHIVAPDYEVLADFCMKAAESPRAGTRLWAIDELAILRDPRGEAIFRAALNGPHEIAWRAERGLKWLGVS